MFNELQNLKRALGAYIEATYHISHPSLVDLRRSILDEPGTISQRAYLESTPIYRGERCFSDLAIPQAARDFLSHLGTEAGGRLVFDDGGFEEVLLLLQVHRLAHPGEGVGGAVAGREPDALEPPIGDVLHVIAKASGIQAEDSLRETILGVGDLQLDGAPDLREYAVRELREKCPCASCRERRTAPAPPPTTRAS